MLSKAAHQRGKRSNRETTISLTAVSMQLCSLFALIFHLLQSPSFSSALPLVLTATTLISSNPQTQEEDALSTNKEIRRGWRLSGAYCFTYIACSLAVGPSLYSTSNAFWVIKDGPQSKHFGRVLRGRKTSHMKWPSWSHSDREEMERKPAAACCVSLCAAQSEAQAQMCLMHIHVMHIPSMLLYSWSPFWADPILQKKRASSSEQLALQVFHILER